MQLSKGYWQTYKEIPNDAEIVSHQLMIRAGLINKTSGGIYTYLPMGLRAIKKVEKIVREEMDKIGSFELLMSVVTPGELWKETGRWDVMGALMLRFQDRAQRDLCISPTNEETVTDVFRKTVRSYKQLPVTLYQINTKFRDEIRPRFGLMRGREFVMKDAYSFHMDKASLDKVYDEIYQAYENIFKRIGLEFIVVEADGGAMAGGKSKTHEFQVVADSGEDYVISCSNCGYAANIEKAESNKKITYQSGSLPMKKTSTPNKATIDDVCQFLQIRTESSLKALAYTGIKDGKEVSILCFVIGTDTLNEAKLNVWAGVEHLKMMSNEKMRELGLVQGFIGPFNLNSDIKVVFDNLVDFNSSYVVGAQEKDFHNCDFVPSRDYKGVLNKADLRNVVPGENCIKCGKELALKKGIEVGHIFQLGDKYSKSMNVTVLDQNGKAVTPIMGCYGIGVTRTVAAAIEQNHDKDGIIWPVSIAPYHVYLAVIAKDPNFQQKAVEIYKELQQAGIEVVFDDRGNGPGVMFKDADLLGLPFRVVLGERDFKESGLLELKIRKTGEVIKISPAELIAKLKELIAV